MTNEDRLTRWHRLNQDAYDTKGGLIIAAVLATLGAAADFYLHVTDSIEFLSWANLGIGLWTGFWTYRVFAVSRDYKKIISNRDSA
jgi:hypothetical protein